jgi:hypothetical protein
MAVCVVVVVDEKEPRKVVSGVEGVEGKERDVCLGDEGATGDSLPRREEESSRPLSSPDEEKNEDEEEKNEDDEEKNGEEPTSESG